MRVEHGMWASLSSAGFVSALFLLLLLPGLATRAAAQTFIEDGRIRALQNRLRVAAEQHASPEQLGALWHSLGRQYQDGFDYEKAEDAYVHASRLLRNTTFKAEYADSLHEAADIYVMQGRPKEAQKNLAQARAIFEELGRARSVASVRCSVAMAFLREHRFREAETEASAALAVLESRENPDRIDLENTYITRARALAGEGRAGAALKDVARARAIAAEKPNADEVDTIATLLVQGEVQMQDGLETEGEQSMAEALKRARALTDIPPGTAATLEASILEREALSLRKAHHKQDAELVEEQMKEVQSAARARCNGCTVSVTSLLPQ